jgi:eukaryotic-like serine/threonine-protein kinase
MARIGFGKLRRGRVINGRYRVEGPIGRGGMSQVVCATDLRRGCKVAIKVPQVERRRPKDLARIVREARTIAQLASPHTARLLDSGVFVDEGVEVPYLVLEYIDGVDLAIWLRAKGPLDVTMATTIVVQACEAIEEAQARGLVHRDIKPANLMLTTSAAGELITKVLDFGVAQARWPDDPRLTATGELVGSPFYMAPEQMRPAAEVSASADVWALGVVLFEAITGQRPFEAPSLPDLCLKILLDEPPPMVDDCPAELVAIVSRCLAKEPTERYASAGELAQALRAFAAASVTISPLDIELAAIEAAEAEQLSSDDIQLELPRRRMRSPRRGLGAALLAIGLAIGLGASEHVEPLATPTSPPIEMRSESPTMSPSVTVLPIEPPPALPRARPPAATRAKRATAQRTHAASPKPMPPAASIAVFHDPASVATAPPMDPVSTPPPTARDPLVSPF